jgi:hypothetical protein
VKHEQLNPDKILTKLDVGESFGNIVVNTAKGVNTLTVNYYTKNNVKKKLNIEVEKSNLWLSYVYAENIMMIHRIDPDTQTKTEKKTMKMSD